MVTADTEPLEQVRPRSQFIYITGCDGTGKSTQAQLLLQHLEKARMQAQHLWLRFPFFFCLPLLAYARWRGYSWYEETDGVRHGYWDFHGSRFLSTFFPWILLIDATMAAFFRIYLPLWFGRTIVCERFVLDMLADMAVALGDPYLHRRLPGKLYLRLLPRQATIAILDLDAETIRQRRPDLQSDVQLEKKLVAYRQLASNYALPLLKSTISVNEQNKQLLDLLVTNGTKRENSYTNKYAAHFDSRILGWLMSFPLAGVAVHWTFQGLLYMDPTERRFKIGLDIGLTILMGLFATLWLPWPFAFLLSFLVAHTLNFLFNAHFWTLLKHYGITNSSPEDFENYISHFKHRLEAEPSLIYAAIYGSLVRKAWRSTSDLDVRIIRRRGQWHGLRACLFVLLERSRAFLIGFPLDIYLLDNHDRLAELRNDESPSIILEIKPSS